MAMSKNTLKTALVDMGLFGVEAEAIAGWAASFREYFEQAQAAAIPIIPAALGAPEAAMVAAMTGLSAPGSAAAAITAGVTAWWASLALTPAAYFAGCTAITPPPGLAGLTALLAATFAANISGALSAAASYDAIATNIVAVNSGGFAAFPGPLLNEIY